jgi:hypothetical protein
MNDFCGGQVSNEEEMEIGEVKKDNLSLLFFIYYVSREDARGMDIVVRKARRPGEKEWTFLIDRRLK